MQPKWKEQLVAMRQELSQQNDQWAHTRERLAASRSALRIPPEFFAELDRVCEVIVLPTHAPVHIYHGAIRA